MVHPVQLRPIQGATIVLVVAALTVLGPGPAEGQAAPSAALTKNGWWTSSGPGTVPPDGIAVSATAGETDKVAAFGVRIEVPAGVVVSSLVLRLQESAAPGANTDVTTQAGRPQATVAACPITEAWEPADGGPSDEAPEADCDLRSEGVRSSTGAWAFDLTATAARWADGSLPQEGVLLTERIGPPLTFQVSYLDLSTGSPTIELSAVAAAETPPPPPPGAAEPPPTAETLPPVPPTVDVSLGGTGSPDLALPEPEPIGADPLGAEPEELDPAEPVGDDAVAAAPAAASTPRATKVFGNLPPGLLLLVPIALAALLVTGVVVGPLGDPEITRRQGAVSSALARRTGADAPAPSSTPDRPAPMEAR
jgi:hypothetical protein